MVLKMNRLILILIFILMLFNSCVFVDDDHCYYEPRCNYVCDKYGNNCTVYDCWDELICTDNYHKH